MNPLATRPSFAALRGLPLAAFFAVLGPIAANGAITVFDSGFSTVFGDTTADTEFANVNVSGTNNMLVIGISGEDAFTEASPPSFSVTWGTTTVTTSAITQVSSSNRNYTAIYVLSGLTAGTNNLTVTSAGAQNWRAGFVSLTSANGALAIAEALGNGGTGTSFSLNFAEDTSDKFVFGASNWNSSTPSTTDLAVNLGSFAQAGNDYQGTMDYENTPGGTSFTYTAGSNRAAITGIAVEVVPEPSSAMLIGATSLLFLLRRKRSS